MTNGIADDIERGKNVFGMTPWFPDREFCLSGLNAPNRRKFNLFAGEV